MPYYNEERDNPKERLEHQGMVKKCFKKLTSPLGSIKGRSDLIFAGTSGSISETNSVLPNAAAT